MKMIVSSIKTVWKILLLFILIATTFFYAMLQGGFVSWFLFFSFLPFSVYCVALYFYPFHKMKVTRVLTKTEYKAGDPLKVKVIIERSNSFPLLYLVMEDELLIKSQDGKRSKLQKKLIFIGKKKHVSYEYNILELPRGEYHFNCISMKTSDLLGLFEVEKKITIDQKIIVYPTYSDISILQQYSEGSTSLKQSIQSDTSMASGIRVYQSGDRISRINWKASAKRNEIMTNQYEELKSNDVIVVMDCLQNKLFESMVSTTATIVHSLIKSGFQVGLMTNCEDQILFPKKGGKGHQRNLFNYLAKIKGKSLFPVETLFKKEFYSTPQTVSYIIITSQFTKGFVKKMSLLKKRESSITVFLLKEKKAPLTAKNSSLISFANLHGITTIIIYVQDLATILTGEKLR